MIEPLPPLPPAWAPFERTFHEIARVIAYSTRFVLIPVAVPGPDLARGLKDWLEKVGYSATALELSEDAHWERLAGFLMGIDPTPSGIVMVIGPALLPERVAGPLSLVNQARDAIKKKLRRPLLWCGPRAFINATWENAPDFWSIRAVDHSLYSFQAPPPPAGSARPPVPLLGPGQPAEQAPGAALLALEPSPSPIVEMPPPARKEEELPPESVPLPPGSGQSEPADDDLLHDAVTQGDRASVAILASSGAESAIAAGRLKEALSTLELGLKMGGTDEARYRLLVLKARALRLLERTEEAASTLAELPPFEGLPPEIGADWLEESGQLALLKGNGTLAGQYFDTERILAKKLGDKDASLRAEVGLGKVAALSGNAEDARAILSNVAILAQQNVSPNVQKIARQELGRAHEQMHDVSAARRVTSVRHLSHDELMRVHAAAVEAGLAGSRQALLAGMDPTLVATLPLSPTPAGQLWSDLHELNRAGALLSGEAPLRVWLKNAKLLAGPRVQAAVFQEALSGPPAPIAAFQEVLRALDETELSEIKLDDMDDARGAPPPPQKGAPKAAAPPEPRPQPQPQAKKAFFIDEEGRGAPLVVVLFSPSDKQYSDRLRAHITPLMRAGRMRFWSSDQVAPGEEWDVRLAERAQEADFLLVLLSADFLVDEALMLAAQKAMTAGKRVIPVLCKPALVEDGPFAPIASLPRDGKPISLWKSEDTAWTEVVRALSELLPRPRK